MSFHMEPEMPGGGAGGPDTPMDGTQDGDGVWRGGRWYPDADPASPHPLWRTHHAPGSAEERYSRQMRFDKYLAMQQLLNELKNANVSDLDHLRELTHRASEILAGMVRPQGPAQRAKERVAELEALAFAYGVVGQVTEGQGPTAIRAATLTVEALRAWERAHPPSALDPLLMDRQL